MIELKREDLEQVKREQHFDETVSERTRQPKDYVNKDLNERLWQILRRVEERRRGRRRRQRNPPEEGNMPPTKQLSNFQALYFRLIRGIDPPMRPELAYDLSIRLVRFTIAWSQNSPHDPDTVDAAEREIIRWIDELPDGVFDNYGN